MWNISCLDADCMQVFGTKSTQSMQVTRGTGLFPSLPDLSNFWFVLDWKTGYAVMFWGFIVDGSTKYNLINKSPPFYVPAKCIHHKSSITESIKYQYQRTEAPRFQSQPQGFPSPAYQHSRLAHLSNPLPHNPLQHQSILRYHGSSQHLSLYIQQLYLHEYLMVHLQELGWKKTNAMAKEKKMQPEFRPSG